MKNLGKALLALLVGALVAGPIGETMAGGNTEVTGFLVIVIAVVVYYLLGGFSKTKEKPKKKTR